MGAYGRNYRSEVNLAQVVSFCIIVSVYANRRNYRNEVNLAQELDETTSTLVTQAAIIGAR